MFLCYFTESEPEQEVQKKRSHTQIDSKTESAEPPKKRGRKPKFVYT